MISAITPRLCLPLVLVLIIVGCAKRTPRSQQAAGSAMSPLEAARLELAQGKTEQALQSLNRILANQPDLPEGLLERARCHMALGKNQPAQADLDRAIVLRPQWTEALYERGMFAAKTGDRERARNDLRQAMTQDVMLELYLNWRGLDGSLESRLRADPGPWLGEFGFLVDAEPNNPTVFLLRGLCHLVDGEKNLKRDGFVQAEKDFTRAIDLFKANPMLGASYDPWANRAFVRAFLGKDALAEEDKNEAFRRIPSADHGREVAERVAQAQSRAKELR